MLPALNIVAVHRGIDFVALQVDGGKVIHKGRGRASPPDLRESARPFLFWTVRRICTSWRGTYLFCVIVLSPG